MSTDVSAEIIAQPTPMPALTSAAAYAYCTTLARRHYENFPVASRLLPKHLRAPISVIYAFARTADDMADEGCMEASLRLQQLAAYGAKLTATVQGTPPPDDAVFCALQDVMRRHQLPASLFYDLLAAFTQDVTQQRYENYAELLDYCRRSANPIGRLLLHLTHSATDQHCLWSDAICSALQIINFLQDLAQDWDENQRIYLPQEDLARYGVTTRHFATKLTDKAMRDLITFEIRRTRQLLLSGAPLCRALPGRLGWELKFTVQGGLAILDALAQHPHDVFSRPRLRRMDWLRIGYRALTM